MAYFFSASDSAHDRITALFEFVWPTAAGMWNLRWQVAGYLQVVPHATVAQLRARFTEGADVQGANLRRACVDHTWEQQKKSFAGFVLSNTIAIYEGWAEQVLEALGKNTKSFQAALQFPHQGRGANAGVTGAITALTSQQSTPMRDSFHTTLSGGKYYDLGRLNEMLLCYRFFKELRNAEMHRGGIADQRVVDAYAAFLPIATPAALGVPEVPAHTVPSLGSAVEVSLRGVVGFSGLVLKIIATIDAELSSALPAEKALMVRWKRIHPNKRMLSADATKRENQIIKMANRAGFPKPSSPTKLANWLSAKGLTQF
jgi:hypothetical protein